MKRLFTVFVKITGFFPQLICFRTKIYFENKKSQSRRIKGAAIIASNHTSVYDFAVYLSVFFRYIRCIMAEVLFKNKFMSWFLRSMGGIYVDRNKCDFGFFEEAEACLRKGGVVEIYPEGRLPLEGEERPLPFKTGAVRLALDTGAPIIPVYTNGSYFAKERARVIIGERFNAADYYDEELSEKENVAKISGILRQRIIELKDLLDERTKTKKTKKSETV